MENLIEKQKDIAETKKKRKWSWRSEGLIAFVVFSILGKSEGLGEKINQGHLFTGFFALAAIVGAPIFYYWIKPKIKIITNEKIRNVIIGIAVIIVFSFVPLFLGALADTYILKVVPGHVYKDRDVLIQLNQNQKTFLVDFQKRWDEEGKKIDDSSNSKWSYLNNIAICRTLQQLNEERYNKLVEYFNQAKPILNKYFPNSMSALSQLVSVVEKTKNVYNEILTAKINYYQSFLDNKSETEIEARRLIVNDAIEKLSQIEQEAIQAQKNYEKSIQ